MFLVFTLKAHSATNVQPGRAHPKVSPALKAERSIRHRPAGLIHEQTLLAIFLKSQTAKSPHNVQAFWCLVHSTGFEPVTARFVAEYSIQLSYECKLCLLDQTTLVEAKLTAEATNS